MPELNISSEQLTKFKFFIDLSNELKQEIYTQLHTAPIGLSPSAHVEFAATNIQKLSKDRVSDIFEIYYKLIRAKESLNVEIPEFLEILSKSLMKSGIKNITKVIPYFSDLLSNHSNTLITAKMIDLLTENQKNFVDVNIYQDIRPAFDDSDNLLGSVVIHNLKIFFKEDNEIKELYISLDNNDLEKLILLLKKAQEKLKIITSHFDTAKLIEIK